MIYEKMPWIPQDSLAWLDRRRESIGASETAAVLGLSPWATAFTVWEQKMGKDTDIPEHLAYFGHKLEPVVAGWVEDFHPEIGKVMDAREDRLENGEACGGYRSVECPWLTATPDYLVYVDGVEAWIPLEIKTTARAWNEVPFQYQVQVQQQMGVLGAPYAYLAVLQNTNTPMLHRFEFDHDLWDHIVMITREFWEQHVVTETPPTPVSLAEQATVWPSETGKTIELSQTAFDALEERDVLLSDAKALKEQADAVTLTLGEYVQDAEVLLWNGEKVATWKSGKPRAVFDKSAFEKDHPELARMYTSEGKPFKTLRRVRSKGGDS